VDDEIIVGNCHCGGVRYRVSGKIESFFCHCLSCRLNSSTPFTAWGRLKRESFDLESGELKKFAYGCEASWYFCQNCGTGTYYKNSNTPREL